MVVLYALVDDAYDYISRIGAKIPASGASMSASTKGTWNHLLWLP